MSTTSPEESRVDPQKLAYFTRMTVTLAEDEISTICALLCLALPCFALLCPPRIIIRWPTWQEVTRVGQPILLENGLMVHHWGMYLDLDTFAHLHNVLLGLGNLTIHLSMGGLKTTCTSSSFEPLWPSVLVSAGSWSSPHLLLQYIPRSSHRCRIPFHHIHSCYGPCYSILIQCCDWGCEVLPWLQLPDPLFQGLVLLF